MAASKVTTAALLKGLLSDDVETMQAAVAHVSAFPEKFDEHTACLLALTSASLLTVTDDEALQLDLLGAVTGLDGWHGLPVELVAYVDAAGAAVEPAEAVQTIREFVEDAFEDRADRPSLDTVTIIGPEEFLGAVRRAFGGNRVRIDRGTPVEQSATTLAGELGELQRADGQA
ncbi:hypothetical protein ACQCX2_06925 [Propionibacteriaceae bacterium Y1700]|uniref:hypothetical protein n=1 Tax=Microlunatus sp. Y1700 TaxID=3418487 RepID=UPI003DA780EA